MQPFFKPSSFPNIRSQSCSQHSVMAITHFMLQSNFNSNPFLQQSFHFPPLRALPNKLFCTHKKVNNAFIRNSPCYNVIKASSKFRVKCMVTNDKPQEEKDGSGLDIKLKTVATEVIWKSFNNVVKVLVKTTVTAVFLGLFFLGSHRNGYLALAASGGRVGGRSFSSFSETENSSSSESSSSSSYSSPSSSSYSSSSSSSSSPSSSSYSSSSSYDSSPESSYYDSYSSSSSYDSSPESSYYESLSTWWNSSPESSSTSSSTWASSPKSSSHESYNTQSQISSPASSSSSSSCFTDFIFLVIFVLIVYMVCKMLMPPDYPSKKETRSHVVREKDIFKTSVLRVQVGLLGTAKSLQKDLDQMAELADTSTSAGLSNVLQEATLILLRHSDYCISGYSSADKKKSVDECEELFNNLTIQERGKFDEETLVNVDNIRKKNQTALRSNGVCNEYIVVTIVAAVFGLYGLPDVKTHAELKTALEKMASIPSSKIMAAEVLWTPQEENDTLSEPEYRKDFPMLRPL